jgi:ABC-type sugar transport system permease subunit
LASAEGVADRPVLDQNGADHDADLAGFPFVFAMTTGVLQAIPDDLYEAATMDGASAFTRLRTITLPLVLYSIAPIIITSTPSTLTTSTSSTCSTTAGRR